MRSITLFLALLTLYPTVAQPPDTSATYIELERQAEASYIEKSFQRAHDLYKQARAVAPSDEKKRWVAFRLADTSWRANIDREAGRAALVEIIREGQPRDRIFAEASESLADWHWTGQGGRNIYGAVPYYTAALDWWAGNDDLPLARRRYLAMVFRMTQAEDNNYNPYGQVYAIPTEILVNAVSIAESPLERAHARFLLASKLLSEGRPESIERSVELLEEIIALGKTHPYYDDALFAAAQRYEQGVPDVTEEGAVTYRQDFEKALTYYRKLVAEFTRGESRFVPQAESSITNIVSPTVAAMLEGTFLPRSEQEILVSWRNVKSIAITISAVDLMSDLMMSEEHAGNWYDAIRATGSPVRRITHETNDRGDHKPGSDRVRIEPKLDRGAYMVQASANGKTSRALLLVTDTNITIHAAGSRSDLFVSNAVTGEPVPNAAVRLWLRERGTGRYFSRDVRAGSNGLATFQLGNVDGGGIFAVASSADNAQAFLSAYGGYSYPESAQWRLYAFTDRPAYRPEETVRWKFIARVRENERWVTPAGQSLEYEIMSPRGEKVTSGTAKLNSFGTFWSELPLTPAMQLGEYTIRVRKSDPRNQQDYVAQAQLFRLEEYKLPEFRVEVTMPDKKQYRLGETIEATIEASYYFGGPVANATVEAVVYTSPFIRYWPGFREYSWYWQRPDYGQGQQRKRETLRTDANGRAVIRIETSRDEQPLQLRIEARVVDASRREVSGSGSVRVLKQRYSVDIHPQRYVWKPNDKVTVDFKAMDANDKPVETTGTVTVVRRRWEEIWIDPSGREVSGRELDKLRVAGTFPPRIAPPWRQKIAMYREEEILKTRVSTDAKGEGTLTFIAPREGYYSVKWSSEDIGATRKSVRDLVTAETSVWVTDSTTTEIGYRANDLEIIVDRDSFRAGQTAFAMIVAPSSGRTVMLTSAATGILDTQILKLDGTVKLVQIALDERHAPSFHLIASSVLNRHLSSTTRQLIVPPVEHFLDVGVALDHAEYLPRSGGTIVVTTRDTDGKPVPAEVALSVSDEAVTAIQADTAGDPRKFFFGELRGNPVNVSASVQTQRYAMLVEVDGKLVDDRILEQERKRRDLGYKDERQESDGFRGGALGRVGGAPPPAAPVAQELVAESITVTSNAPAMRMAKSNAVAADAVSNEQPMSIEVRSDFSSTAFWQPDIVTGPDGTARVTMKFPEALTTWRATARAVSASTQVGLGTSTARTSMPLVVRLQAPRFFVAGDKATISAVINNNTDAAVRVTPSIEVTGVTLAGNATAAALEVPARGEARADWIVSATAPGTARLRVTGRAATAGDAMEKTFTIYEHGIDKLIARSGKTRGDDTLIRLELPRDRRATSLSVQIQPSLAVTMLDALPYLIDYPYGCTEQTMSRFLPAAIVARTLAEQGLDAGDIEGRIFGGIERAFVDKTQPKGAKDLRQLPQITAASLRRLYDFQHGDGGWGWWKEGDSDDFMTAYVVWGFSIANRSGIAVNNDAVRRAVAYLDQRLVQHENGWHMQAWMLHAMASWQQGGAITANQRKAFDNVWTHRDRLTAYSRALFALATHYSGNTERAKVLARNLEDGVKVDRTPDRSVLVQGSGADAAETMGTAHWGRDGVWWRWYEGPVESTSFVLQALVKIDPQNKLIEPAMNWLVKNRRGAQWSNTRDTAIAIFALNDYLRASNELKSDLAYELSVNGRVIETRKLTAANMLGAPARFNVDAALVRDANEIRIRRTSGTAPIYFAVEGRFVSLEEPVKAAGNEMFVRRDYYRLAAKPTLLKGVTYDRVPLRDGESVKSGERVEVVVSIETKNDYDYLLFEDLKPAGLEAVELKSGEPLWATSNSTQQSRTAWVYQELRDRKVAMFIDHLAQGTWEIRYTLRAEVPGEFHALPLLGHAMYVPEIRANGEEVRIRVED